MSASPDQMSFENPTDEELRALAVLVGVCGQYMPGSFTYVDHTCMSAGEHAVHLLAEHGLVVPDGNGGSWTTKANLLEHLDDISLSNIDEIRAKFRALPDGELLTVQPGSRPHKHDVQLDLLRIWFPARAIEKHINRPQTFGRPGPDRLDVEARLDLGDATATIRGEILTIGELETFRDQLVKMVGGSKRSASLKAYRDALQIQLLTASSGMVGGEITIFNPIQKHSTTSAVDLRDVNLLKSTVDDIDGVLAKFNASI